MPDLNTKLHIDMLKNKKSVEESSIYDLHWGDPENDQRLAFIRDQYIYPYINPKHRVLEIRPGGGRWTRYLLSFKEFLPLTFINLYLMN